GGGVGFDGVTATPPNVSITGLAGTTGCASDGRDTRDRLTMADGSSIGRSSPGGGGSGTGPESSVGTLADASCLGASPATCVGPEACSAAANGDSVDGPLSGSAGSGASGCGFGCDSSRRSRRGSGLVSSD